MTYLGEQVGNWFSLDTASAIRRSGVITQEVAQASRTRFVELEFTLGLFVVVQVRHELLLDAFGEDYFDNPQKEKALHWMIYEDPRNGLNIEERGQVTNLIQRFSLVSFYFQTSAQQPWASCNPPAENQLDTCYYGNPPREIISTRWLTAVHECQWMGVGCTRGTKYVTRLEICECKEELLLMSRMAENLTPSFL